MLIFKLQKYILKTSLKLISMNIIYELLTNLFMMNPNDFNENYSFEIIFFQLHLFKKYIFFKFQLTSNFFFIIIKNVKYNQKNFLIKISKIK